MTKTPKTYTDADHLNAVGRWWLARQVCDEATRTKSPALPHWERRVRRLKAIRAGIAARLTAEARA